MNRFINGVCVLKQKTKVLPTPWFSFWPCSHFPVYLGCFGHVINLSDFRKDTSDGRLKVDMEDCYQREHLLRCFCMTMLTADCLGSIPCPVCGCYSTGLKADASREFNSDPWGCFWIVSGTCNCHTQRLHHRKSLGLLRKTEIICQRKDKSSSAPSHKD